MKKLKLKNNKRKLNKSGFTLIEVFFSFLVVIAISVMVINAFSKRENVFDEIKIYEEDHNESMKAVSKALLFSGIEDSYKITLTNYVPVINIDARNELHLVNTLTVNGPATVINNYGKKYEVFYRYKLGETTIETYRDNLLDDYRVAVSVKRYAKGTFDYTVVDNLKVIERGKLINPGAHYTISPRLFNNRLPKQSLNNLLIPVENNESEVDYYQETY